MKKSIIFCDFDGTITNSDNIIAIMRKFAPPGWEALKDDILAQRISIQEGVGKMFALLPSTMKEELTRYILETSVIRDGFEDFIHFTKINQIPLYVISGGINFFVEPMLKGLVLKEQIYCNKADFSNEYINILWPHACDENCSNKCGCCKPSLIRQLSSNEDYKIVIGDSITDVQAAKLADEVIARDFLVEKCNELGIKHHPFTTFFDVIDILTAKMVVKV